MNIKPYHHAIQSPVLISPLNWGLGHATRCIPIIRQLSEDGFSLVIAAEGSAAILLGKEFPNLPLIAIDSYEIHYARKNFAWAIFKQIPKIVCGLWREHQALKSLILQYGIKTVISDNRYGLWNRSVHAVFMTHQVNIQLPNYLKWGQGLLNWTNRRLIEQFNECWIPDFEGGDNISGILSHPAKLSIAVHYLGMLSRFEGLADLTEFPLYRFIFILSGPEPQRNIWEKQILDIGLQLDEPSILVRGVAGSSNKYKHGTLSVVDWMDAAEMFHAIELSECIVCRSGYSSMMDLAVLGRKAIVVATSGQTEQEYLAKYLTNKQKVIQIEASDFTFNSLLTSAIALER